MEPYELGLYVVSFILVCAIGLIVYLLLYITHLECELIEANPTKHQEAMQREATMFSFNKH